MSHIGMCPYSCWCGYFLGPLASFVTTDEFSLRVTKITSRIDVLWIQIAYLSAFNLFLTLWIMPILSEGCKPDNFEPYNSLKHNFMNIWGVCSNLVECESFLESNSPDILALCETNLNDSIGSDNFSLRGYLSLIQKDPITYMHVLEVYVKERIPFAQDLSLENSVDLLMFLTSFASLSVLILFSLSITSLLLCANFDCILSNLDEVLQINPPGNMFAFGD